MDIKEWRHVFKLDPDKELDDSQIEAICESGTDAIMIGGTQGVSFDNTIDLMARVRRFPLPCVLEVSNIDSVVPGFDLYLVPMVVNSKSADWIVGKHVEGLMDYGALVKWHEVAVEGYIILNPDAEAAKLTQAKTNLTIEEAKAYARFVDQMLKLPILYIEYSGTYGDPALLQEVRSVVKQAQLFYGGGIKQVSQAAEIAKIADTVIVGNVIYENLQTALETVNSVKNMLK